MPKFLHNLNLFLLIFIELLEAASITMYSIIIKVDFDKMTDPNDQSMKIVLCCLYFTILANLLSIIIVFTCGINAIVFQKAEGLIICSMMELGSIVIIILNSFFYHLMGKKEKDLIDVIANVTNLTKGVVYLVTIVTCLIERSMILSDMKRTPLNYVDDDITESMYKNLLTQCRNPQDKALMNEYERLYTSTKERKSSSNYSGRSRSLNHSEYSI